MESPARSRLQHRMALLAALPLFLLGVMSAPAGASDQGSTSSDGARVENNSGPGTSAPAEEPGTTDEPASTEESGSSEGSSSSGQSGGDPDTSSPTVVPEAEGHAAEEPVAEDSPAAAGPGATVPRATPSRKAPSQAAGDPRRAAPQPKVTICHRTSSRTNPYNQIAVAVSAIVPVGHVDHTGPIFSPTGQDWGDIIPPVPGLPGGLNWPEGRPILDNGCEVQPDVGPLPRASIGDAVCDGTQPTVAVTVTNGADATAPAEFAELLDGVQVSIIGPLAPGESRTVVVRGPLQGQENQTFTVEVRSPPGGVVIASRVITADCAPGPPDFDIGARLTCRGAVAEGRVEVTNNEANAIEVTATIDGAPVEQPALLVGPGETGTAAADLSPFEDRTITVEILVDGDPVATYTVTPDCVGPQASPSVSVAGLGCPPPSATVTLGNTGDPESQVVFVILVDGKVVQETEPVFGGDTTTIVGDLSRFEDQTVVVELRANGEVLGSRTIKVNCLAVAGASASSGQPGSSSGGVQPGSSTGSGVLPAVGAGFGISVVALGLGLPVVGSALIAAGSRRSGSRSRQA